MAMHIRFGLVVLVALLVMLTGCASLGIPVGPPPGQKEVGIDPKITVRRPPANAPVREEPATTYAQMLGSGYARIGQIRMTRWTAGGNDRHAREELLLQSQQFGAEVAWITIEKHTNKELAGMGADVKVFRGSIYDRTIYGDAQYNKYPYYYGTAVLFARDPQLAARQLSEAAEKWEKRMAAILPTKSTMIAKITKLGETVYRCEDSMLKSPSWRLSTREALMRFNKRIEGEDRYFEKSLGDMVDIDVKLQFKDPAHPLCLEISALAADASSYFESNFAVITDSKTQKLPEHLMFD